MICQQSYKIPTNRSNANPYRNAMKCKNPFGTLFVLVCQLQIFSLKYISKHTYQESQCIALKHFNDM